MNTTPTLFDLFKGDAPAIVEPPRAKGTPRARAEEWFAANPRVFALLESLALEEARYGAFGMKYLFEVLRFKVRRTWAKDADGFRLNNNYTATAGRMLIAKHPHLAQLIELRKCREEETV